MPGKCRQLFLQKALPQMFQSVLNMSPIIVSENVCFFCYFFHFESIKFRSSSCQIFFKIEVFKNFAMLTGKHLCWSVFKINLLAYKPANLFKRDSSTINIAKFLRPAFYKEHLWWLHFKAIYLKPVRTSL